MMVAMGIAPRLTLAAGAALVLSACGAGATASASRAPAPLPSVPAARPTRSAPFVHPGILVNAAMLGFVRAKIAARQEPWTSALAAAQASRFGRLDYAPHPRAIVDCGSYSKPDNGCSDEKNDALAAYTHALLWAYTGSAASARKSIEIMNAWAAVLKDHTNRNAPLQAAWAAELFPRAAEIIRHTDAGWAAADVARFGELLRGVYLPKVENGSASNGNWEISMIEAALNIAVFDDDRAGFDRAVHMWRERAPAYIYLTSDGPAPVPPPRGNARSGSLTKYWYDQAALSDGLAQETCRDLHHVQFGLAGLINTAETAFIQGVDLYAEQDQRLRAGLEFHARYLNGAAVPAELCGGSLQDRTPSPTWEIAFNHFANRRGEPLPESERLLAKIRPTATDHHMAWETLTHAGVGWPSVDPPQNP
jgi:hypothetical protein